MKKVRTVSVILAAALCFVMLSACDSSSDSKGESEGSEYYVTDTSEVSKVSTDSVIDENNEINEGESNDESNENDDSSKTENNGEGNGDSGDNEVNDDDENNKGSEGNEGNEGGEDNEDNKGNEGNDGNEGNEGGEDSEKGDNDKNDPPLEEYDPFEHIKIAETGYSGVGKISIVSDCPDRIRFVCNVKDRLKNGDSVVITIDTDDMNGLDEYMKQTYGLKIIRTSMNYVISKLKEPESFDPFNGLNLTYDGVSGEGTVKINSNKTKVPSLHFVASKTTGLSNGQIIKVSIIGEQSKDEITFDCLNQGLLPTVFEKEFTVEGLPFFAKSLDDIPVDLMVSLIKDTSVTVRDRDYQQFGGLGTSPGYLNKHYNDNFRIDALDLLNAYFMTSTSKDSTVNQLVLIYQEDVYYEPKGSAFAGKCNDTYYNYAIISNIVLSYDKSEILSGFSDYSFCENLIVGPNMFVHYCGYSTADQIYQTYVKSQDYKYNVEELDLSKYDVK